MTPEWIRKKADAFVAGWRAVFGTTPPKSAVIHGLSVATHETRCGDAWPDSHNWGATTLRPLSGAELAAVAAAGLRPTVGAGHEELARKAQQAIVDAGLPLPRGEIHCDSAPGKGAYFVWFAAFSNDADGAAYFIKILAKPNTKFLLELEKTTSMAIADSMYRNRYYTGFFKPDAMYLLLDGKWQESPEGVKPGSELNVEAYGGALARLAPTIRTALADWTPTEPAAEPSPEELAVAARQAKLHDDLSRGLEGLDAMPDEEDTKT